MRTFLYLLYAATIIFVGNGCFKRWCHNRRVRRDERYKKKQEAEYKRRFAENQIEIERWRRESERRERENMPKGINVTCKNPLLAPIFKGAFPR